MRRMNGRRTAGRRKPQNVQWSDVSAAWNMNSVTATTANVLIQLQSPTSLTNLTADPPEDLTVLRVVGDWSTTITPGNTPASWTLALTVADVTWTPGATVAVDNDKRLLWQMSYEEDVAVAATTCTWYPPGMFYQGAAGTVFPMGFRDATHLDISPKVRVEAGKALYLVAYENAGNGSLLVSSATMRVLYKRSGRR